MPNPELWTFEQDVFAQAQADEAEMANVYLMLWVYHGMSLTIRTAFDHIRHGGEGR